MSKEQIKRILLKFRDDTSIAEATNMMPPSLDYYAEQILALFPQGDVGRWVFKTDKLTPLQVLTCVCQQCPFPGELETRCSWCDYPKMMEFLRLALSAIDDFYQQRETQALKEQMERVMGIVVDSFYGHRNYVREAPGSVNWKEFLFSTLDHMENELVVALKSQLESE